jgi:outer membrane protein assembly factor BamB
VRAVALAAVALASCTPPAPRGDVAGPARWVTTFSALGGQVDTQVNAVITAPNGLADGMLVLDAAAGLVRLDGDGQQRWAKQDIPATVVPTADGGALIAFRRGGFDVESWVEFLDQVVMLPAGRVQLYIVRLAADGSLTWMRESVAVDSEELEGSSMTMVGLPDDGFVLLGTWPGLAAEPADGTLFVAGFDAEGARTWSGAISGFSPVASVELLVGADGALFMNGRLEGEAQGLIAFGSSPAIEGGVLVPRWQRELPGEERARLGRDGFLYVADEDVVVRISTDDGTEAWRSEVGADQVQRPLGYGGVVLAPGRDGAPRLAGASYLLEYDDDGRLVTRELGFEELGSAGEVVDLDAPGMLTTGTLAAGDALVVDGETIATASDGPLGYVLLRGLAEAP